VKIWRVAIAKSTVVGPSIAVLMPGPPFGYLVDLAQSQREKMNSFSEHGWRLTCKWCNLAQMVLWRSSLQMLRGPQDYKRKVSTVLQLVAAKECIGQELSVRMISVTVA
jgi:hypothetical protein